MLTDDYWMTNLLDARLVGPNDSFDITFPISERTVNGGRAWAARKYPFRNGQSDEDTGAEPRTIDLVIPLFRGVDQDHYPDLFNQLVEAVESDAAKGRAELTDPEFGPINVRMKSFSWSTRSKEREGGQLKLSFETLGDDLITLLTIESEGTPNDSDPVETASETDDALADAGKTPLDSAEKMRDGGAALTEIERLELGLSASYGANIGLAPGVNITVPTIPAVASFTTSVTSTTGFGPTTVDDDEVRLMTSLTERFVDRLARGDISGSDEVGVELDVLRARIASVRTDTTLTDDPEKGWPVMVTTTRLIAAVTRVAEQAFLDAPRVVDYTVRGEMSALEVAVDLFRDPVRVQDIIDLNPGTSPDFYARGTLLIVPLE